MKLEISSFRSKNISMGNVYKENEFYKGQMILYDKLKLELKNSKEVCEKLIERKKIIEAKIEPLKINFAKFTKGK